MDERTRQGNKSPHVLDEYVERVQTHASNDTNEGPDIHETDPAHKRDKIMKLFEE